MMRKTNKTPVRKLCYFCVNGLKNVDYRDTVILRRFTSSYFKIAAPRRSGLCSTHQRKAARAIKRAREMSLLPYCPS